MLYMYHRSGFDQNICIICIPNKEYTMFISEKMKSIRFSYGDSFQAEFSVLLKLTTACATEKAIPIFDPSASLKEKQVTIKRVPCGKYPSTLKQASFYSKVHSNRWLICYPKKIICLTLH